MLDHENAEVAIADQADEELPELVALGAVEPGGRLVEQEEPGPPSERPGDLNETPLARGDLAAQTISQTGQADVVEQGVGDLLRLPMELADPTGQAELTQGIVAQVKGLGGQLPSSNGRCEGQLFEARPWTSKPGRRNGDGR
ncbi:MAG: hypothetical protein QOJ23_4842 [Actinomycetota bacterium]|nr:hypothetical protein [Actinomycetota bacterium]MDQ1502133.1 hypothetical protein [Actinomycetota bacterium]MDQ1566054.1 hypothetical protein [Actinomycetota bacterium]